MQPERYRQAEHPRVLRVLGMLLAAATAAAGLMYVASASWDSPRLAVAVCVCLFLLHPSVTRFPAVVLAAVAVALAAPWQAGASGLLHAMSILACTAFGMLGIAAFRAAATVRGLGQWQALAFACSWLLLADFGLGVAAAVLIAVVCLHMVRGGGEECRFNTFLGALIFVLAAINNGGRAPQLILCLFPLLPLALDVAAGLIVRYRKRQTRLPICERLDTAGSPRVVGRVLLTIAFGWCGVVAWWAWATAHHVLIAAAMAVLPLSFAVVVVALASAQPDAGHPEISNSRAGAPTRIRGLDGLRAVAVALVVLSHSGLMESGFWQRAGVAILLNAQVGVQIFFVLSGLLITHLLLEERARSGRVSFVRFYLRRMLRIFPVYYAAIAVSFAIAATSIYPIRQNAFLAAVGYVMNFASWDAMESTFSHFWSLAVEEHFYFIWPLAIALLRGSARAAAVGAGAAVLLLSLWQAFPPDWVSAMAKSHAIVRWTIPAAMPILVGCFAAAAFRWRRPNPLLASLIGLAGLIAFLLPLVPSMFASMSESGWAVVSSIAIAAIIIYLISSQDSLLVNLLEARPLVYLGTISYGVYIWQGILTGNGPYRQIPYWPPSPLVGAVAAVLVAAFSYRYFEKPILGWKDKLGGCHA